MNNTEKLNQSKKVPINCKDGYLFNYLIDDVVKEKFGRDKLLLIRMAIPYINNKQTIQSNKYQECEYVIFDIYTNDFKINYIEYNGNEDYVFSKIIDFKYIEENDEYVLIVTRNKKNIYNLSFSSNSLTYEIKGYVRNEKAFKNKENKDKYIYDRDYYDIVMS